MTLLTAPSAVHLTSCFLPDSQHHRLSVKASLPLSVAIGLAIIARAAEKLGWTDEPIAQRIITCLKRNRLPVSTVFSAEELAHAASADKKRAGNEITLVIPRKIGVCELKKVPVTELLSIISAGLEG